MPRRLKYLGPPCIKTQKRKNPIIGTPIDRDAIVSNDFNQLILAMREIIMIVVKCTLMKNRMKWKGYKKARLLKKGIFVAQRPL